MKISVEENSDMQEAIEIYKKDSVEQSIKAFNEGYALGRKHDDEIMDRMHYLEMEVLHGK